MPDLLNSTPSIEAWTQRIIGCVTVSGTTATLAAISGATESDQTQVSLSRTSTGIYVITVTNFRGPQSQVNVQITSGTTSVWPSWTTKAYTANTDTVAVTVSIENDASTATDSSFDFLFTAF